jgi:hypothetical protein
MLARFLRMFVRLTFAQICSGIYHHKLENSPRS